MSSVEDKLTKFQFVCEDKLKKIELLKVQHEKNEKILLSFETDYQRRYDLAKLNLKLAQKQLELGNTTSYSVQLKQLINVCHRGAAQKQSRRKAAPCSNHQTNVTVYATFHKRTPLFINHSTGRNWMTISPKPLNKSMTW